MFTAFNSSNGSKYIINDINVQDIFDIYGSEKSSQKNAKQREKGGIAVTQIDCKKVFSMSDDVKAQLLDCKRYAFTV